MEFEDGARRLRAEGWLAGVSPGFRDALLPLARWQRAPAGALLARAGDEQGDLIGLASGTVAFTAGIGTSATPTMHVAEAVTWLGYAPLVQPMTRAVTTEARTPVTFASFPQAKVEALLRRDPWGWKDLVTLVGQVGLLTTLMAADLLIPESEPRCAAVLLRFAGQRHAGPRDRKAVTVPVTQEELAAAANLSRNSVGKILRRFASEGWIATGYGGIRMLDPVRLRALLD